MCQMPNIWHIYHTKHKNEALWDVPNYKNYTTWLQYRCKFATVRTDVVKILLFYIFPFLSPLSSFFLFSPLSSLSHSGSLSLLPDTPIPSLFSLYRFPLSSTSPPFTLACRFLATVNAVLGHCPETKSGLRLSSHSPWLIKNTSTTVRSSSITLDEKLLEKTLDGGGGKGRGGARSHPHLISPISPSSLSSLSAFHSASL